MPPKSRRPRAISTSCSRHGKGRRIRSDTVAWFNGGLFDGRRALRARRAGVELLSDAGGLDWSQIDPTIFGTLFERFLDPEKRGQIGAHYTDPDKIMMIVEPVILRPLRDGMGGVQGEIEAFSSGEMQKPPTRGEARPEQKFARGAPKGEAELRRLHRASAQAPHSRSRPAARAISSISPCRP